MAETLIDALDDSGSAKHAGFEEKEARRIRRQKRLAKAGRTAGLGPSRIVANPEYAISSPASGGFQICFLYRAGEALVLHKDSPKQEAWNRLKETNPLLRTFVSLRQSYDESENPVISSMRSLTEGIGSWFDENETAQVTRLMKNMDPTFTREGFERELREYIVPEVVDAYLSADKEALQAWCGEAVSYCNCCSIMLTHLIVDIQRTLGYNGTLSSSRFDQ